MSDILRSSEDGLFYKENANIVRCYPDKKIPISKRTIYLSEEDREKFYKWGVAKKVRPPYKFIHHAFERFAKIQPWQVASEYENEKIYYGELNDKSNALAKVLRLRGVRSGDNVGLFVRRSNHMLVGLLAILKCGACYVPQDISIAPVNQLRHIVEQAGIKTILSLEGYSEKCDELTLKNTLFLDRCDLYAHKSLGFNSTHLVDAESNCFILFTSGTTGIPNGVQVSHKNVCNILLCSPGNLGMQPGLNVSQFLNIGFDMAAWEILGCLAHGASLVIRNGDFQSAASKANIIIATPSILGKLDPKLCPHVKTVAVAGEPCPVPLAKRWAKISDFYNCCGPTETTIINTAQLYKVWHCSLSIGKPTPNNSVYILNKLRQPCAIGEIGEMWAGGDCVTNGYLNNPTLNSERYAPDPFSENDALMFNTRDLGRWNENGELEHMGRVDDQVKIRGFRVELDGVSSVIEISTNCLQALTLKLDNNNIVSFVKPKTIDKNEIIKTIKDNLPYYCEPSLIIPLNEFPLTCRGKIDKEKLIIQATKMLREKTKREQTT